MNALKLATLIAENANSANIYKFIRDNTPLNARQALKILSDDVIEKSTLLQNPIVSIDSDLSQEDLEKFIVELRRHQNGEGFAVRSLGASPLLWPTPAKSEGDAKWEGRKFGKGCRVMRIDGKRDMRVINVVDIGNCNTLYVCEDENGRTRRYSESDITYYNPTRALSGCTSLAQSIVQSRHALGGEREDGCVLYGTGDADAPKAILDTNGEVVLACCRNCGRAEVELDGSRCPASGHPANDNVPGCMATAVADTLIPRDNERAQHYSDALEKLAAVVEPQRLEVMQRLLVLQDVCHGLAAQAGWWIDMEDGVDVRQWPKKHFDNWVSAKLMLTVTEVAEAMEGHRKGLPDDKLPWRDMREVELADAVIRIFDLAGGLNYDLAGAVIEKLAFNMHRPDHKLENRKAAGGKSV